MHNNNTVISILVIHALLYSAVILNIPILQQCIGFIYLTFVPGFVVLRALKITEKDITETFLLSVTLSVALVMFIGLLSNAVYPLIGLMEPLSAIPSTLTIGSFTLIVFMLTQRTNITKELHLPDTLVYHSWIDFRGAIFCGVSLLFLVLSIIGAFYTNTILIFLAILGTAGIIATCTFSKNVSSSNYYSLMVFLLSLSLLFQTSLLSTHIMGWDIFNEYYVFQLTRTANYWTAPGVVDFFSTASNFGSLLSITILPTIYSTVLNVDGELVFKVIFPFIFACVPIFLYKTYECQSGKLIGLVSAFFFIANPLTFYGLESLSLAREMIGYLFIAAAIFSILNKDMNPRNKRILLIICSAGVAVSAYSLSFIYIAFIVFIFIALRVSGRRGHFLSLSLVITMIAIIFAWYMFVATPPLNKVSYVINNIFENFTQDIASSQARLDTSYSLLSPTAQTTFVGLFHKLLIYLTHGFIVLGALIVALKPKIVKFSLEFRWMIISAAAILVVCLVVPNVAPALNFSRFYRASMMFLAPLYVIGGICLFNLCRKMRFPSRIKFGRDSKTRELFLLCIILSAFFLFRVGLANYVSGGYPISYPLNFDYMQKTSNPEERMTLLNVYVPEQDISSAKWLGTKMNRTFLVYGDSNSFYHILPTYALLPFDKVKDLYMNITFATNSYVYLSSLNLQLGIVSPRGGGSTFNLTQMDTSTSNKIYSNDGSAIYYSP